MKVLFLCHNVVEHESKWMDKLLTRIVLKNGNYFIVHSGEDEKNLIKMFPKARVRKTFHPTYNIFNHGDFDSNKIRKHYEIKTNIILFFGFVREYKGLKFLLEAMSQVVTEVPVTLLVVGEFWNDKQDYQEIVKQLKIKSNVIFVDKYVPNEEVGDFFSAADLVAQPYLSATGSGIVQIAFGFNKPVIATKVGSLPEIIVDGKTGYLVSPQSSAEIAQAIVKFFQQKKAEEFKRNIEGENYKFSWDLIVDVIEGFFALDNITHIKNTLRE